MKRGGITEGKGEKYEDKRTKSWTMAWSSKGKSQQGEVVLITGKKPFGDGDPQHVESMCRMKSGRMGRNTTSAREIYEGGRT